MFGEVDDNDLENILDGQSHRYQSTTGPAHGGRTATPRAGPVAGPNNRVQSSAPATGGQRVTFAPGTKGQRVNSAPANRVNRFTPGPRANATPLRTRCYSPTAHGTVRDHGGIRQQLPTPPRHQNGNQAPTTMALPQRRQGGQQTPTLPTHHQQGGNQATVLPTPTTTHGGRTQVATTQATTVTDQGHQAQTAPAGMRADRIPSGADSGTSTIPVGGEAVNYHRSDSEELNDGASVSSFRPESEHDIDVRKLRALYEAVVTGNLFSAIKKWPTDGPAITKMKIHLVDAAIESSRPTPAVVKEGPEWVEVFHATRKFFVGRAFDIRSMPEKTSHIELAKMTGEFWGFRKLHQDAMQARTFSRHVNNLMRAQWEDMNKRNVLKEAVHRFHPELARGHNAPEVAEVQEPASGTCKLHVVSTNRNVLAPAGGWPTYDGPVGLTITLACEINQEMIDNNKFRHIPAAYIHALGQVAETLSNAVVSQPVAVHDAQLPAELSVEAPAADDGYESL